MRAPCVVLTGLLIAASATAAAACEAGTGEAVTVAAVTAALDIHLDDGRRLKLAGLAPPGAGDGSPEARALDERARTRLTDIIAGEPVDAVILPGVDRHGRHPAALYGRASGIWLAGILLDEGLARVVPLPGQSLCTADLLPREDAARRAGSGLWALPTAAPIDAAAPGSFVASGRYALAEGRVFSVNTAGRRIYVNFGWDHRSTLTAVIATADAEAFGRAGFPLTGLKGRRIRVRGWLETGNGPQIRLTSPEEMEWLADPAVR